MFTNVPSPLPDECLRGYGFRVHASNASDILTANQLLPELSKASGLSTTYLVTNHGYLSYARFAHSTYGYLDTRTHPDFISNKNISNCKTLVPTARFCPHCIKADIDKYGTSYWHRIHHLPGVDHCIKHDVSLINANSKDGYKCQPMTSSIIASAIPENRLTLYFNSEYIKKFSYLSASTLEMGLSFEYFIIRNALINQYTKLEKSRYLNLSKLAYSKFPPFWLNMLFYGIVSDEIPSDPSRVYEALKKYSSIKSTKYYLIMMALLWNDPQEALRECLLAYYSRPLEDGKMYFVRNKINMS